MMIPVPDREELVERVFTVMRPTVRGMVDSWTKDDFEGWVDRVTRDLARRAVDEVLS